MSQKLKADDVLNKSFHVDFKGYNPVEVDKFLDDVLHDYDFFEKIVREQKELLERYEKTLNDQRIRLLEVEGKERATTPEEHHPSQFSHVDILKRVSRLEEAVFNINKER